jgi:hypothetical protein
MGIILEMVRGAGEETTSRVSFEHFQEMMIPRKVLKESEGCFVSSLPQVLYLKPFSVEK